MRPEMWAMTTCPFSSCTRNMVLGRVSRTVPSIAMTSALAMWSGSRAAAMSAYAGKCARVGPAIKIRTSGEVLVELAPDLLLDHALERGQQQAQLGAHSYRI